MSFCITIILGFRVRIYRVYEIFKTVAMDIYYR